MNLPLIPPSRCTSTLPNDLEKSYLIAEPKLDGSRYVLYLGQGCDPYERQRGNTLLSRRVSTVDHKHVDRTLNIPHITTNLQDYFTQIVQGGGEGIIVKDTRLGYGTGWSKYKRSADVSCIITGFKPGNGKYSGGVGSIALSVYQDEKLLEIGFASGFKDDIRTDISKNPKKYIGKVVDVFAQEISKDNRLRHPTWHRFRDDIESNTCTLEKVKEDLVKHVKGNRKKYDFSR